MYSKEGGLHDRDRMKNLNPFQQQQQEQDSDQ
jgi:hypothetical protein